jgi:hypothetical protein
MSANSELERTLYDLASGGQRLVEIGNFTMQLPHQIAANVNNPQGKQIFRSDIRTIWKRRIQARSSTTISHTA